MPENVKSKRVRAMSPRAQRILGNMVESATTPSEPYKVKAASGGYVVYRPDLRAARVVVSRRDKTREEANWEAGLAG